MPQIAIVVPARNEAGNLPSLVRGIAEACRPLGSLEIIVVDDGSTDASRAVLADVRSGGVPELRILAHGTSAGQSAAVHSGVSAAASPLVATLDGDGQNPPAELPRLLAPLLAKDAPERLGLVAGQRVGRKDTVSKRWASGFANRIRAKALKDGTRDTGCGLKAFRRAAFLELPYFDHMHRYLPALMARAGWEVAHVDVAHAARGSGRSNYSNLQRGLVGIVDLIGVMWLIRRRKRARPEEL